MRNYTPQGELKVKTDTAGSGGTTTQPFGTLLASGYINPLAADDDGVALLQALSVLEDLDGLATAQAPSNGVPLSLEPAASSLIPPRFVTLTSIADLSAITFEIVGTDQSGDVIDENLAGPAGAPEDADGIALSQAPTASTPLVLEAPAADLDPPRPLTFTSAANLSGVNFAIVGLDENGAPQTVPAFAGPNNETLTTSEVWSEVTSITPDATDANTLTVGWPDTAATVQSLLAYGSVTSITPDASDAENVEAGWLDSSFAFPLTLALTEFSPARRITLTSTDDLSIIQFQVIGQAEGGAPLSETLAGPNNGTVSTTQRYATLEAIVPLTLGVGSLSAGWPDELATLYTAPSAAELSHLYLRNTDAQAQDIELFLVIDGEELPWRQLQLAFNESAAVLEGEAALPFETGHRLRAQTSSADAVAYSVYGTEESS